MGVVLAEASPWTYVAATYGAAIGLLGGYAAWVIAKGRKVNKQLPPEDRRWSS